MSKTWYGHYIDTIKGNDYVLFKDYLELDKIIEEKDKEIERLNHECDTYLKIATKRKNIIDELEKWLKDVDIFQMNFIENKEHITPYKAVLDKLIELKGDNNDRRTKE